MVQWWPWLFKSPWYIYLYEGFLTELGPHMIYQGEDRPSANKNPYSWNNEANMLFLESPPGAGYSINEDKKYQYNDTRTATDNLMAIK